MNITVKRISQDMVEQVHPLNKTAINVNDIMNEGFSSPVSDYFKGFSDKISHTDFPPDQRVYLTWKNIHYEVTPNLFQREKNKVILKAISGSAPPGTLTGILGPSGAGKTTLVNILSGYYLSKFKGLVLVNGQIPTMSFYRQKSSYTPHDMYLFPLTVRETMMVAANLKLPRSTTKEQREKRISAVLEMLSLTDIQNTNTNKLSGGEKKRMYIAQELVHNPPLMLFDEPTSGLDSSLTYQITRLLVDLAKGGRTIICTIHQPSSSVFEHFDNISILSKGECIYSGLRKDFPSYLATCDLVCPQYHNPADFAIDIASDVLPGRKELLEKQKAEIEKNRVMIEDNIKKQMIPTVKMKSHRYPTGYCNQFFILLKRIFFSTLRQPWLTILYVISLILLAALIGVIYSDAGWNADKTTANIGLLALTVIILTFVAIMPTLLSFPTEKEGVIKEYHNGWYSIETYFLAKTIAEIPFNFIFPTVFTTTVYWLTGQPHDLWRYFYFVGFSILLTLNAQSIPIIVGALFSAKLTVFLVPAICLPLLLFCNFFIIRNTVPPSVSWISHISPFSLAYAGIIMTLYGFDRPSLKCSQFCIFKDPKSILFFLSINDAEFYINFGTLFAILAFLRIMGYVCLIISVRRLR